MTNVILDVSAACHMPDVIEMPYMPPVLRAKAMETYVNDIEHDLDGGFYTNADKGAVYRLGGPTCLSGDIIGDYYFEDLIKIGNRVIFGDMAIYTTCKNNTFNGMPLPSIYALKENGDLVELISFGYEDFKVRLGK